MFRHDEGGRAGDAFHLFSLRTRGRKLIAVCCLALAAVGCGGDNTPRTVPIKGKVTLNGQPLTSGEVTFAPTGTGDLKAGTGQINSDGTFVINTFKPGDGVQPGDYKICIRPGQPAVAADGEKKLDLATPIPEKYQSPATTDLSETVSASDKVKVVEYKLSAG